MNKLLLCFCRKNLVFEVIFETSIIRAKTNLNYEHERV